MDNSKNFDELIHDKKFLKRNDFAEFMARAVGMAGRYKVPLLLLAGLILLLLIGIPIYNYYQTSRSVALSDKLYEAQKSLKKEALYTEIVKDYGTVPAARVAHLRLADYYLDNDQPAKAHDVIEQGLASGQVDVLSTMLVLKKVGAFQAEKKYKEALEYAKGQNAKVLPAFQGQLQLLQAELALSAGDREQAKSLYTTVAQTPVEVKAGEDAAASPYNPQVVDTAKEQLLLMDLGLL